MKSQHRRILLLYSPWIYTLVAIVATGVPFYFSGPEQLAVMRTCGPVAMPFGLLGFYFCFRSRHPRFRDLAIWLNLASIGLGFMFVYLGYF
jgi:hypothetical protein